MTEGGVDVIVPWAAQRCVTQWHGERGERALARWRATAREAAKQSRRAWLPEVTELASTHGRDPCAWRRPPWPCCSIRAPPVALSTVPLPGRGDILVIVGPEGGLSPAETAQLTGAGAVAARLGPTVLRTSSAGLVAASRHARAGPAAGDPGRRDAEWEPGAATSSGTGWPTCSRRVRSWATVRMPPSCRAHRAGRRGVRRRGGRRRGGACRSAPRSASRSTGRGRRSPVRSAWPAPSGCSAAGPRRRPGGPGLAAGGHGAGRWRTAPFRVRRAGPRRPSCRGRGWPGCRSGTARAEVVPHLGEAVDPGHDDHHGARPPPGPAAASPGWSLSGAAPVLRTGAHVRRLNSADDAGRTRRAEHADARLPWRAASGDWRSQAGDRRLEPDTISRASPRTRSASATTAARATALRPRGGSAPAVSGGLDGSASACKHAAEDGRVAVHCCHARRSRPLPAPLALLMSPAPARPAGTRWPGRCGF